MDIPIKWGTPNIINSGGIKIHVAIVTRRPNKNILSPVLRYFLSNPPSS